MTEGLISIDPPKGGDLFTNMLAWKFEQATKYMDGQTPSVQKMVKTLAKKYGDVGHFPIDDPTLGISREDYRLIEAILNVIM
jgi:hypothetical protein